MIAGIDAKILLNKRLIYFFKRILQAIKQILDSLSLLYCFLLLYL